MSMDIGKKMRTDWINLDKKVENKNKSKRGWERWLRTTTETKQKQIKKKEKIETHFKFEKFQ